MIKPYNFTFAGKNSYDDFKIEVEERPIIPSPERKLTFIEVPGRSSRLTFDEKAYKDITITVPCWIKATEATIADRLDDIMSWLISAPESDLIFSHQPNARFRARVVNSIDFRISAKEFGVFPIVFLCRPFKYALGSESTTINYGAGVVTNITPDY